MAHYTLRCPGCKAPLKLANPPTAGKKIRCPNCQAVFTVPHENGAADDVSSQPPRDEGEDAA